MWHKRHRQQDTEAPPGKRLRDNIAELFSSGAVPGDRAQSLLDDASAFAREVHRPDMQELRGRTSPGSVRNKARDLRTRLLQRSQWPPFYVQEMRFWSPKQKEMVVKKVAMLLPHEIVDTLAQAGEPDVLVELEGLDEVNKKHHRMISEFMQKPFVSLSLWGDGIPYSWDRKASVDVWTLSLPGLTEKKHRDIRIPLTGVPHHFMTRESQDDLLSVLAWSFQTLARGLYPTQRADGAPWTGLDTWRKRKAGTALLPGALIEMKGDWKQLQAVFGVPGWAGGLDKPICWRCTACKRSLKEESGPESPWLQAANRLEHFQCLERILEDEGELSPFWSFPWARVQCLRLDWLHVCDQGIAPVYLGGLFHLVLSDKTVGQNVEQRCEWLWRQVQNFYTLHATKDKLHNLTVKMIKPKKGSIELSGNAAQVRALIPFGLELVESWPEESLTLEHVGAKQGMKQLSTCYAFLSSEEAGLQSGTLLGHALAFQRTVQNLHGLHPKRWQVRPKLHLFLELAAEGGCPSSSWNYREESFGGSLARQAHVKGGFTSPLAMSTSMLAKFCAKESLPKLHRD